MAPHVIHIHHNPYFKTKQTNQKPQILEEFQGSKDEPQMENLAILLKSSWKKSN